MKHGSHENLGYLLTRASFVWNQHLMKLLRAKGFLDQKPSFGAVFIPIFDKDGLSVTEIAKLSKITKQTTSIYIRELEGLGYIRKEQDKKDTRSLKVYLTTKGKKLKLAAHASVKQANDEFRKHLDATEFKQLHSYLRKCI